jgi:2-polyprenyl-3-methyl-5-hydroxy-6-metoxy-1,4-benzoquinol methylase
MSFMAEESLALTATLNQLAELDRYNKWLYEQFAYCLGRRVLEVGSGTGNITQFLCSEGRDVVATDIVPAYRDELRRRFSAQRGVAIDAFDLNSRAPRGMVASPFDTVVCLNVLEHIEDDMFALGQLGAVMARGGMLALLVPAHKWLYGEFDRAVGHFRRYEKRELATKLSQSGLTLRSLKFFSFAAALPWLVNGRILKRDYLPAGQTSLADRLVPLLKLERFIGPPCGLSLIAIAQKP